jgi:uncharacterized protein
MKRPIAALILLALCGCAAEPDSLNRPFESWQSRKFHNIERQRTDFTCGAASLSIISEHFYGRPISEVDFTTAIRETYSKDEWLEKEKNGLTLLDMKHAAEHFGFSAEGLKMTLSQLADLKGPVIVHLNKGFVEHFSVFKGIVGDRVYLADPISGNSRVPVYRFMTEWTGYALAIWIEGQELPLTNGLKVDPRDGPNELDAARGALYAEPNLFHSPF